MLRIRQWYKNLLIFIPIIFAQRLGDLGLLNATIMGFFALCLVSSANYIINDIADREKDRHNPEKRSRLIASGKIKVWQALIIAIILLAAAVWLSLALSMQFLYIVLFIFGLTQLYSFALKKELFADIIAISLNFVARAVSGVFVASVIPYDDISPWLILCAFFLSLFLAVAKREGELLFIKQPEKHRQVLSQYTPEITGFLLAFSAVSLIISYSLFSVLGKHAYMVITLPFVVYTLLRYFTLIKSGSVIARHPEYFIRDKKLVVGIILWGAAVLAVLYVLG